ncbi:Re/Si-specific NAD(P)(+) transhydrogenase subunit alpha [Devosia sp.]|uniref:Re/Si-specific NAD(P)(+) transhydrogenase subunit alpha n=1 Tax=Devosia sp. TaxID=1871048 RepID=UPI0035B21E85
MKIAVLRERADGETRVAATPETVAKLIGLGATVAIEAGAGDAARFPDADYAAAGASVGPAAATVKDAEIVLAVRRPSVGSLLGITPGALVVGIMDPYGSEGEIGGYAKVGLTAIAMEFMPRITRAQVMDVLSSQANLAGYQAVIDAAGAFDRAMPMMMTAAGTVRPAKVFVMGAGVAGLQAIATAKRLGAVVTATDVRAAAGEQVESLGAKFIMTDALKDASGSGGYARELTQDEQAAQAALVAGHIAKQDIVITTALIPGRPAPKLVSRAMVESMAPGSVIVDLAAERGGNVEVTQPGKVATTANGVTIIGHLNVPGRLATSASQLYARNLVSFLETLIDKKEKKLAINWDDELVKATVLTRGGAVVHPNIKVPGATPLEAPVAADPAKTGAAEKSTPGEAPAAAADDVTPAEPAKTGAADKKDSI